ncbi:hypothetical protein [Thalassotalea profundi]|uniref:Uncharacterized protein n=1 Tax=Thalassotalea profundi TaxID=2036687 RepID=A0ABQ3J8J8_9GAMM|nr:hypothetical protein [Thalassotalea profundi]GHF02176.1 hypothetical protein GCM10011501_34410 [Thalassotalea profundi]
MTSMDSLTPFHQQINRRITIIACLFSCFFIGVLAIFYSRESDLFTLKRDILPSVEKQVNYNKLIANSKQLLTEILIADNPKNFSPVLSKYQDNLKALIRSDVGDKQLLRKLLADGENYQVAVERLSVNHEKNEQLKKNTIVQLQLVNTALSDALKSSIKRHHLLYQQSINLFSQAIIVMENVTVATDIDLFTEFTERLNTLNQQWLDITANEMEEATVVTPLLELNNLLWVDQRSIAKWRSHIRISQEFRSLINKHYQVLLPLSAEFKLAQRASDNLWPKEVLPWLPPQLKASESAYYITLVSILAVFVFLLMLLLMLLATRIKRYQQHSMTLLEQRVEGDVTLPFTSLEQQKAFELINQLTLPAHSENEYQQVKTNYDELKTRLAKYLQLLVWSSDIQKGERDLSKALASEVLALKPNQCWYHAFSRQNIKGIFIDARQAKLDNTIIERIIQDKQGRVFSLTIEFTEHAWHGILCLQDRQAKLEKEIVEVNQTIIQNEQDNRMQRIENSQVLSKMLIRTMLQSQSASLGFGVAPLKVYRHLIRMLEWSKQLQLTTLLGNKDRQVKLTDVNFINELYVLMSNILVDANLQRNTISYTVDSNIIEPCKLNIRLFHQTLSHFCHSLLQEQYKGHLHLAVTMADKNSGQQILNFVFNITHLENSYTLPETIMALTQVDGDKLEKEAPLTQYFSRLFNATYCEQLQTKVIDKGYQISFKMPITTAVSTTQKPDVIDLNQRNLMLLSDNSLTVSFVTQIAKKHQAKLSVVSSIKAFTKQVNAKQLLKEPVATLIVADNVFSNDFSLVTKHVDNLPLELQPKIFVLQPICNQAFHRIGMYQHSQILDAITFAAELKQFIKSERSSNLLLAADIFTPYRFSATQVEVLLAVAEPKKHEILQRLLHWMGLQVHLVCNAQQMQKQWKSGRYLILINEFDDSAIMQLEVGKKVKRAVYAFTSTQLNKCQKDITDEHCHWEFNLLPNVLDIGALVNVFSSWLKELQLTQHHSVNSHKVIESKSPEASASKKIDLCVEMAAFDLVKYAQNQGSSELAGFMILDYINEIGCAITQLAKYLEVKDAINAERCLTTVLTVTKIMVANDLANACLPLMNSLSKKDFKGATEAMQDIQIKYQLLATYAESI